MIFNTWFKYKIAVVIASLGAFLFVIWHSYYTYIDNVKEEDVPLIKAKGVIVFKPKDPGGMIVPDKDKDIYNSMKGQSGRSEKIKLANETQPNISKAEAIALINKQTKNKAEVHDSAPIKVLAPVTVYYIRVAKIISAEDFDEAVKILKKTYPMLSPLKEKLYEKRNLGNQKYYVHLGPIYKKIEAYTLCQELKKMSKACKIFVE